MTRLVRVPVVKYDVTIRRYIHHYVSTAIKNGELEPIETQLCIACGSPSHTYHHNSYEESDWLDVIPMCNGCHRALHHHGPLIFCDHRIYTLERQIRKDKKLAETSKRFQYIYYHSLKDAEQQIAHLEAYSRELISTPFIEGS